MAIFDQPLFLIVPPVFAQHEVQADILGTNYNRKTNSCSNHFQGRDVTQNITNGSITMVDANTAY